MKKTKDFEIIHREALFQGYFRVDLFHIRQELYKGGWSEVFKREVLDTGKEAAFILLFDPEEDKVIMIEEFRSGVMAYGENPFLLQCVAGIVDAGETPQTAAKREAKEEAGCTVTQIQKIYSYYPSPGCQSQKTTLFVGRTKAPEDGSVYGLPEEGEDIKIVVMDASKAINLLYTGELKDASSIIAMQWFSLHRTDLRSRWLVSETSTPII